jgi:hypothetical protein
MDEVKWKQVDVSAGGQIGKEETNLAGEMVYDLGMKCWKRRMVEGKRISMPVVGKTVQRRMERSKLVTLF